MRTQQGLEARRRFYAFYCWLYFSLGVCCAGAGVFIGYLAAHQRPADKGMLAIAGSVVVFGLLRAGLALYRLYLVNSIRKRARINLSDAP